jgi:hypothetical protein
MTCCAELCVDEIRITAPINPKVRKVFVAIRFSLPQFYPARLKGQEFFIVFFSLITNCPLSDLALCCLLVF